MFFEWVEKTWKKEKLFQKTRLCAKTSGLLFGKGLTVQKEQILDFFKIKNIYRQLNETYVSYCPLLTPTGALHFKKKKGGGRGQLLRY